MEKTKTHKKKNQQLELLDREEYLLCNRSDVIRHKNRDNSVYIKNSQKLTDELCESGEERIKSYLERNIIYDDYLKKHMTWIMGKKPSRSECLLFEAIRISTTVDLGAFDQNIVCDAIKGYKYVADYLEYCRLNSIKDFNVVECSIVPNALFLKIEDRLLPLTYWDSVICALHSHLETSASEYTYTPIHASEPKSRSKLEYFNIMWPNMDNDMRIHLFNHCPKCSSNSKISGKNSESRFIKRDDIYLDPANTKKQKTISSDEEIDQRVHKKIKISDSPTASI